MNCNVFVRIISPLLFGLVTSALLLAWYIRYDRYERQNHSSGQLPLGVRKGCQSRTCAESVCQLPKGRIT
jgi:hypothetical protein